MSYNDPDGMTCFLLIPDESLMTAEFSEYLQEKRYQSYPTSLKELYLCRTSDEVNKGIETYKSTGYRERDYHWAVFGLDKEMPDLKWQEHYFRVKELSEEAVKSASFNMSDLRKGGCWFDNLHFQPDRTTLYKGPEAVLFLDVDGVLNRYDGKEYIEEDLVDNLAYIIHETGAAIILTSSWRRYYASWAQLTFPEDETDFGWYLAKRLEKKELRIAGATPILFDGPDGRPFEIRTWLSRHSNVKRFVILDDEPFWKWNWLETYLVETCITEKVKNKWERHCGLTRGMAEQAIQILNNNQRGKGSIALE